MILAFESRRMVDGLLIVLILLVGYIYTSGVFQLLDIGLYDESYYLYAGLD